MSSYSYSRLDLYSGCPACYRMRYLERRPELPSEALEDGSETHDWIARYNKHLLEQNLRTDLDWIRGADARPEVKGILDAYGETHLLEPGNYVIEEMWKIPLGQHLWWGMIDLLRDEGSQVLITDYKTDHRVRSQTEIDTDRQLRYYAWMAAQKYPHAEEFACTIDFVRHGVTRSTTYDREDVPEIEREILDAIARMEADEDFKARPGTRCGWCSYTSDCRAIQAGDLEIITCASDAEYSASQLVALKARVRFIEDQLKPWCTREGSIPINGMLVGYRTSHSASYNTAEYLDALEAHGYEPVGYVRPDSQAIKRLVKADGDFAAALEGIARDNARSTFTVWKGEQ